MQTIVSWLCPYVQRYVFHLALVSASALGLLISWAAGSWLLAVFVLLSGGVACGVRWGLARLRRHLEESILAESEPDADEEDEDEAEIAPRRRPSVSREIKQSKDLIEQMLDEGRYALLLRPQIVGNLNEAQVQRAREALDDEMALTPEGPVLLRTWRASAEHDGDPSDDHVVRVEAFFLDRYAVTNRDYLGFVESGGYEQMSLWDPDIWSGVLDFVDRSGQPGPAEWKNGCYPRGRDDHPVVGVCWYEAAAYARWVGKRLPTDAEWVKAASWPVGGGGKPIQRKYPWGDAMDHRVINVWAAQIGDTVPVQMYEGGVSVGGAYQLIGNVWEWTHSNFGAWDEAARRIEVTAAMKSIRGGAFDTYFDSQATCQFQSGDSSIARKHNIGFRCCLALCDLAPNLVAEWSGAHPEIAGGVEEETGALEAAL